MDPFTLLVALGSVGVSAATIAVVTRLRRRGVAQRIAAMADELGLAVEGDRARGRLDGHDVEVFAPARLGVYRLAVGGTPEGLGVHQRQEETGGHIGDPSFDAVCTVTGDERVALAVLRGLARSLIADTLWRIEGQLQADGSLVGTLVSPEDVVPAVRRMVRLARQLDSTGSIGQRLLDGFQRDTVDEVRWRCFDELMAGVRCPEAEEAAHLALDREADTARTLAAALYLRDLAALEALASKNWLAADSRIRALEALRADRAVLTSALLSCLAPGDPIADRAAELAAEELVAEAAPALRRLLESDRRGVRVAAIEALGRVGTVADVPALTALGAAGRNGRRVRAAIEQIQSRLDGVERGAVSLAVAEGGAVTLATEDGQVSLEPEP